MILVTGAIGFVGQRIMKYCKDVVAAPSLRNASEDQVRRIIEESGADTVIHTAAISDPRTCQENPEESYQANVTLPVFLAKALNGRKLVCFSSDMVYTGAVGDGPYTEKDAKPANLYAQEKLEMEDRVLDICPDSVMLRAEWMYDYDTQKPNYFMNILGAKGTVTFSSENYRGVTYVKEVAENMEKVKSLPGGVYNFGSETDKSMHEITKEFVAALGLKLAIKDAPALHSLWMDCSKAADFGVRFSSVSEGLLACAKDNGVIN